MVNRITIPKIDMFDDLPAELQAILGQVQMWTTPPQGMTSRVALAHTQHGDFAIKYATGALYSAWLAREHRVLSALSALSLPAPRAYCFARRDLGITPERWLLMDAFPGETLSAVLLRTTTPTIRHALLRDFGQTLARIHRAAPLPAQLPSPQPSWLDAMLDEAAENLKHFNVDGTPALLALLRQTHPPSVTPTLIHGDYTIDNVMVHNGHITGVIDWSGGAIGDPRYDLALATRFQPEAFSSKREADLQAFYEGYGASPLKDAAFDYFNGLYEFF
jgi:aminoglycoside phosphotransferase (APT) family kinase protein